ncbi:MAG: hypothetical protein ACYC4H_14360 [Desulfocucumaceae bacterium]
MKVYLIAGTGLHDSMVTVMNRNGFEIIGHEYTLDAAVIALRKKPLNPDLIIINGLAQASGATEGVINRNRSMLVKLKDIRMITPNSRVLLLLSSENPPEVIRGVISLGIYDIHQISKFDESTLLEWIEAPMSIADFIDFKTAHVPDNNQGEISYGSEEGETKRDYFFKKVLEGIPSKGLVSKIAGSFGGGAETDRACFNKQISEMPSGKVARRRAGKPGAVLGVGDVRIEEWIGDNFSDQMDILFCSAEPGEIKQKITQFNPDILILMRQSAIGGIPEADELAVWSAAYIPAILFIVGELDGKGREMLRRAEEAGVRQVISCDKGGFISGDELVYVLNNILREMQGSEKPLQSGGPSMSSGGEAIKAINALIQRSGIFSRTIKPPEGAGVKVKARSPSRKLKPRINMNGGLSLDEETSLSINAEQSENPTAIVPGGILAVVSPWRPNLAGRLAAQAVKLFSEVEGSQVTYIGASGNSTGALWLNVSDEELMMSDWRVPGSNYPIVVDNIRIFAVDPAKDLLAQGDSDVWVILKEIRKETTYTVMDFGGDMQAAQKAAHQGRAVVLVVLPGNDPVEYKISSLWLRNLMEGKQNVVTGIDLRGSAQGIPEGLRPKVVIRNNPADALGPVLKKTNQEQFIWN